MVRALAFIAVGHLSHHVKILRERYLEQQIEGDTVVLTMPVLMCATGRAS